MTTTDLPDDLFKDERHRKWFEDMAAAASLYAADPEAFYRELDPELRPWRSDDRFHILRHPLMYVAGMRPPAEINRLYREKCGHIAKYVSEGKYSAAINVWYEKPYRLDALAAFWAQRTRGDVRPLGTGTVIKGAPQMTREQLQEALTDAWMATEMPGQMERSRLLWLFREAGWTTDVVDDEGKPSPRPDIGLTLWRGVQSKRYVRGLSWTTDPGKAEWFARRWQGREKDAYVYEMSVRPEQLLARFTGRGESEYVVDTSKRCEPKLVATLAPKPREVTP